MDYTSHGFRELISVVQALEEALTRAYEEQGITRSDAQGVVEAIVMKAS
jgi:hypothetical protein